MECSSNMFGRSCLCILLDDSFQIIFYVYCVFINNEVSFSLQSTSLLFSIEIRFKLW